MTALPARGAGRSARVGRLDWAALQGVLIREVVNFSSYWRGTTFSSTMEPTVYLIAFGFGFGSLVSQVAGYDYVDFVGTGTVATAVLFSRGVPGDVRDVRQGDVPAHVRRDPRRAGRHRGDRHRGGAVDGHARRDLRLHPDARRDRASAWTRRSTMLTVPFIAFLAGFGWACFGIMISGLMKSFENFNYVVSGVLTPMMLTAGTFFPLSDLPEWAQMLGNFNPLHHCVELVRHAAFGWDPGNDVLHLVALVVLRRRDVAHRRVGDDAQARDLERSCSVGG